jgi:hypothetical protein
LLGAHRAIVPINEPLIGLYLSPFLSDLSGWSPRALDETNFTIRKVQDEQRDQFLAREFRDVVDPALGELIRKRFLAQVVRYPPRAGAARAIAAVKEPAGSQSADLISSALPDSRLLFLLRDGRDMVDSAVAANVKGSWVTRDFPGATGLDEKDRLDFVVEHSLKWLWRTQTVQDAIETHPGPTRTLKYEDLLAAPVSELAGLFDWLGLDATQSELEAMVGTHSFQAVPAERRGKGEFHRAATPGMWRENLRQSEIEAMDEILGPKLRELGYEP